jgi:SAM-dependent methyltransferase
MEMKPLPFDNGSVYLAYTSHTIEHITTEAALSLFREVRRSLVPGGIFRITCPDADILCNAVASGRLEYWNWRTPWFFNRGADKKALTAGDYIVREIATSRSPHVDAGGEKISAKEAEQKFASMDREDFLNWLVAPCQFRSDQPGLHMNWWTFEKCRNLLRQAGFGDIYRSAHGASLAAPLQNKFYFDSTRPEMSLYIDAING